MIYSKVEFAAFMGFATNQLAVYIQRKKVILTADSKVDDSDAINQLFIHSQQSKSLKKVKGAKKKKVSAPAKEKVVAKKLSKAQEQENKVLVEQQKEKGSLDTQKRRNEIHIQEMDIKKRMGKLVPTDQVQNLIIQHSESMKSEYGTASDNLIEVMALKKGFDAAEVADLRAQNRRLINKAIDDGILATKKKLAGIVEDFAEKRGVGQHD